MPQEQNSPENFRDLSDFVANWDEIRPTLSTDVIQHSKLPAQTQETIKWLRLLADHVCALPADPPR